MRRICSDNEAFERRVTDLKHWLTSRGHKISLIDSQIDKARGLDRDTLLSEASARFTDRNRVYLVLTYHPALSKRIYDIIREN